MKSVFWHIVIMLAIASVRMPAQTNTIPGNPVVVNGNLGVGTQSPGALLDVAGTSLIDIVKVDFDRLDPNRFLILSSYGQDGVIRIDPGPDSTIFVNREVGTAAQLLAIFTFGTGMRRLYLVSSVHLKMWESVPQRLGTCLTEMVTRSPVRS